MSKFKAGDPVYYPQLGNDVYRLQPTTFDTHPVKIYLGDKLAELFTRDGKLLEHDKTATIFHATPKNRRLLEQLHDVELESPPIKKSNGETVKTLFQTGDNYIWCVEHDTPTDKTITELPE